FSVRGDGQHAQGRRKSLPATTCQRSTPASCYGVRSRFGPRGRDTYSVAASMPAFSVASRPSNLSRHHALRPSQSRPSPPWSSIQRIRFKVGAAFTAARAVFSFGECHTDYL